MKKVYLKYRNETLEEQEETKEQKGIVMTQEQVDMLFSTMGQLLQEMKTNKVQQAVLNPLDITRAIQEGIQTSTGRKSYQKTFTKADIPTEDILETPVMFFSSVVSTAIFDDVKKGKIILCPFNPIKFKPLLRYQSPTQKGKTITQCLAVIWSKKQVEFMREHTDFNIRFFEKVSDSANYTADFLEKVVDCYNYVKTLTDYQVQQKLLEQNIKIQNEDFSKLRKNLAYKLAENAVDMSDLIRNQSANDLNEALEFQMTRDQVNNTPAQQTY